MNKEYNMKIVFDDVKGVKGLILDKQGRGNIIEGTLAEDLDSAMDYIKSAIKYDREKNTISNFTEISKEAAEILYREINVYGKCENDLIKTDLYLISHREHLENFEIFLIEKEKPFKPIKIKI